MSSRFTPFPVFETERLILRKTLMDDLDEMFFLRSDPEVNRYIEREGTVDVKETEEFIRKITQGIQEGRNITWAIGLKENSKLIGSICLWNFSEDFKEGEVGYSLHPEFQGKGIMSEALTRVLEYGFEKLQLRKVEAYTHHANESSRKLLDKHQFQLIEGKKDPYNENNLVLELVAKLHTN